MIDLALLFLVVRLDRRWSGPIAFFPLVEPEGEIRFRKKAVSIPWSSAAPWWTA